MRIQGVFILALFSGFFLLNPHLLFAQQQDTTKTEVEDQLEKAFEEIDVEDSGLDGEQLTQFLEDLAANPVNINSASLDDLLQVPGMNLKIARAILDYRKEKPFESKEELLKVKGVGSATYRRMQPYVAVGGTTARFRELYLNPQYWTAGRKVDYISRFQQDMEEKRGDIIPASEGGYLGSPVKYYQRLRVQSNHVSLNLTQEKDAGEAMNGLTGFDFTSGHIALKNNGKLKDLIIGDYSASFGQGLVLWSGGAFGKGREVTGSVSKNGRGVNPYSSAQETNFFRGVAATYGDKLEITTFYSSKPRTASVVSGDTTRFPSSTGFHRTINEKSRKNNINQTVVGGRLRLDTRYGLIGASGYYNSFSTYVAKGTALSNLYDFEGYDNSVLGIDYRGLIGNAFVFGEIARSQNGGLAGIAGMETAIGDNTELTLAYRNYGIDFQNFMGAGFGESSSSPQNQEGLYIGLRHYLNRVFTLSSYVDQFRFPAPRFGTTQATQGIDMLALAEANISSRLNIYVLLRSKVRDSEYEFINPQGSAQLLLGKETRNSIRTNLEYRASTSVRLRTRVEYVRHRAANKAWESGFLVYQDLRLNLTRKLQLDTRVTLFDTESFNTRVYQFESDLLYVMSNTMLNNSGQRFYAVIKYDVSRFMDLWIKYGFTHFEDLQAISSGLNEIQGNRRSSVGIQARVQF